MNITGHLSPRTSQMAVALVLVVALLAGLGIAWGGWLVAVVLVVVLALGILVKQGPYVILLAWIALSPFTQGRVVYLGADVPDLSVDRVLLLLAALVVLSQVLAKVKTLRHPDAADVCLLVFLGWGIVSVLVWRPIQPIVQLGVLFQQYFLPAIMYWIVVQLVDSEVRFRQLLFMAMLTLIILSLPTPLEELMGVNLLGEPSELVAGVIRVRSFTRSAWELGTVAGILLALATHALSLKGEPGRARLGTAAVALGSIAIALTFMRASWLAMLAVFVLTGIVNPRFRRWTYVSVGVATLLVMFNWTTIMQTNVWLSRVSETNNVIGRVVILQQQWQLFTQSPLLGYGLQETRFYSSTAIGGGESISHNMYMSTLLDFGLSGVFYFLAIAARVIKGVSAYHRLSPGVFMGRELVMALLAAVAVFLIEAATLETRVFASVNTLFWMTLGLLKVVEDAGRGSVVQS